MSCQKKLTFCHFQTAILQVDLDIQQVFQRLSVKEQVIVLIEAADLFILAIIVRDSSAVAFRIICDFIAGVIANNTRIIVKNLLMFSLFCY